MTAKSGAGGLLSELVAFGRSLREEGLAVGPGRLVTYCVSVSRLDPADPDDLYWAGRACLVSRYEDLAAYDRAFARWRSGAHAGLAGAVWGELPRLAAAVMTEAAVIEPTDQAQQEEPATGALASSAEVLRHKRFADCNPDELAALQTLMSRLRLRPPDRWVRRTRPARAGRKLDLRRTVRAALRSHGELFDQRWRVRRVRRRRLVLILDVSASMASCSRALLQFAHSVAAAPAPGAGGPIEVFCFGTRLTRITRELRGRQPDQALTKAAAAVLDWDGGTRIGESLATFSRSYGRRGIARGAVVVICSDGLERGDPEVLARELARLARLAHRIVWVNPLKGDPRYQPLARGMSAALPFVDHFVAGHDLASLEALADLLPALS